MDSTVLRRGLFISQLLLFSHIVAAAEPLVQGQKKLPEDTGDWSYSGSLNQRNWGKKYPSCNGARQSPVDIDETFTQVRRQFQNLQFEGWHRPTSESTTIHNNGKTVAINVDGEFFVSGGGLSSRFRVARLSFHWGRCNATSDGSEHSLNGMKYPLEMQIYCYNPDEFQSLDEAIKGGGRLAALAVLFEVNLEENEYLDPILEAINSVSRFGKSGPVEAFTLRSLFPNNTDKYYIYNGSLTAPPCSEVLEWIVFKHTMAISEAQLEVFCEVMTMEQAGYVMLTDYLQNNFREQQQQFMGQVFASYTGVEDVHTPTCSSEPQNVQADAQNDTTIVVTWERPRAVYDTTIDWYTVTYQRLQGREQKRQEYRTDGDQDVGAMISTLLANSSYVVQVVAVCTNGLRGRWSDQIIVDMPLEDPESDSSADTSVKDFKGHTEGSSVAEPERTDNQRDLDMVPEDHSPVEEIPVEQTRVYQNQRTHDQSQPTDQTQAEQDASARPTPDTPPDSTSPHKTQPSQNGREKLDQNRLKSGGTDQNGIEGDQLIPAHSNTAIWVTQVTQQPGFLFPVTRTTAVPSVRRQMTEEASLSVLPPQVRDPDPPDQASENRLPASELYTPSVEDVHVTDVFYEDTVTSSALGTVPNPTTVFPSNVPGNEVDKDSPSSSEDSEAPVNKPNPVAPDSSTPSSNTPTASGTLADPVSKPFTTSSLLKVLMHTTLPMFNANTPTSRTKDSTPGRFYGFRDSPNTKSISPISSAASINDGTFPAEGTLFTVSSTSLKLFSELTRSSRPTLAFQENESSEGPTSVPPVSSSGPRDHLLTANTLSLLSDYGSNITDLSRTTTVEGNTPNISHTQRGTWIQNPVNTTPTPQLDHDREEEASADRDDDDLDTNSVTFFFDSGGLDLSDSPAEGSGSGSGLNRGRLTDESGEPDELPTISYLKVGDTKKESRSGATETNDVVETERRVEDELSGEDIAGDSTLKTVDRESNEGAKQSNITAAFHMLTKKEKESEEGTIVGMTLDHQGSGGSGGHIEKEDQGRLMTVNDNHKGFIAEGKNGNRKDYSTEESSPQKTGVLQLLAGRNTPAQDSPALSNCEEPDSDDAHDGDDDSPPFRAKSTNIRKGEMEIQEDSGREGTDGCAGGTGDRLQRSSGGTGDSLQRSSGGTGDSLQRSSGGTGDGLQHASGGTGDGLQRSSGGTGDGLQRSSGGTGDSLQRSSGGTGDSLQRSSGGTGDSLQRSSGGTGDSLQRFSGGTGDSLQRSSGGTGDSLQRSSGGTGDSLQRSSGGTGDSLQQFSGGTGDSLQQFSGGTGDSLQQFSGETGDSLQRSSGGTGDGLQQFSGGTGDGLQQFSGGTGDSLQQFSGGTGDSLQQFSGGTGDSLQRSSGGTGDSLQRSSGGTGDSLQWFSGGTGDSLQRSSGGTGDRLQQSSGGTGDSLQQFSGGTGDSLQQFSGGTGDSLQQFSGGTGDSLQWFSGGTGDSLQRSSGGTGDSLQRFSGGTGDSLQRSSGGTGDGLQRFSGGTGDGLQQSSGGTGDGLQQSSGGTGDGLQRFSGGTALLFGTEGSPVSLLKLTETSKTAEEQMEEGSNSSHESRVGLVEAMEERRTVVPLAVVSTLTIICLLVLVAILIYWRNCFQTANFYPDDSTSPKVVSAPSTPLLLATDGHEPLTVKQFVKHVIELHITNSFSKEFEIVKESYEEVQACTVDMGITVDSSNHPENKSKNRYINILAYDHSRVKLSHSLDKDGKCGDYINANFVDGYERTRAYIAAQGPLRAGREDFWKMIWQQNVGVIVMITNLKEKGRTKCDQYWPEENQEEYGSYQVTLKNSRIFAYYTLRTFTVRDITNKVPQRKGEHTVLHYHYTQWPDMGVPDYTLPVLSFIRASSRARTQEMGPVLVHCSAGVGRTGTYIVIDSMLQQIQDQGTVNVLGFLKHVRTQRNFLVQTEEQYVFIHDALMEAILSRDTLVTSELLHGYVSDLLTPGPTGRTRMDKQFKLITQRQAKHADYSTALKDGNAERNRARALMPVERSRVSLSASETNSTGYINASYVTGHHSSQEFIVSQTPLSSTVADFWRMIWEHQTHTIVHLPDVLSQSDEREPCILWPSREKPLSFDGFTVSHSGEDHVLLDNDDRLLVQDVTVTSPQNDQVLAVRQYGALCWPNPDSPIRNSFDLVSTVREHSRSSAGPIVVHDPLGGATSGLFCALTSLHNQLEEEGAVDVYKVARMTNLMRPGVFNDVEQYQFLYRAVLSLVSSQEDQRALQSPETNGSVPLGQYNVAESLESLM